MKQTNQQRVAVIMTVDGDETGGSGEAETTQYVFIEQMPNFRNIQTHIFRDYLRTSLYNNAVTKTVAIAAPPTRHDVGN